MPSKLEFGQSLKDRGASKEQFIEAYNMFEEQGGVWDDDAPQKIDSSYEDILSTPKHVEGASDEGHSQALLSTYYQKRDGQKMTPEMTTARVKAEFGSDNYTNAITQLQQTYNIKPLGGPTKHLRTRDGYFSNPLLTAAKSFPQIAKSMVGTGGLAIEQMLGGGKEFKTPLEEKLVDKTKRRTKAVQGFIDSVTPESWTEAEEAIGQELSEQDVGFFRMGFLMLAQNAGNLGVAATTPAPVAFASMFSTEREGMASELTDAGLNQEAIDGASSLYGMISAPIEYIENVGRIKGAVGEKGVKALTKPVQKAVAGMLKNAGVNVGEELTQKLAHDLVYNMAVTKHNELTGESVPLLDLTEGTGDTIKGSLSMSVVLDAMGLPARRMQYKGTKRAQLREMRQDIMDDGGKDVLTEPLTAGEAKQYGEMLSEADIDELYEPSEQRDNFKKAIRGDKGALQAFNQNNVGGEVSDLTTNGEPAPAVEEEVQTGDDQSVTKLYRAEAPSYSDDSGAVFYTEDKSYAELYLSEDRVMRETTMPSREEVVDIRDSEDALLVKKWVEQELVRFTELYDNFELSGLKPLLADAKRGIDQGDTQGISQAIANVGIMLNKESGASELKSGVAEKAFLEWSGKKAMIQKEAGRDIDEYSVAFKEAPQAEQAPVVETPVAFEDTSVEELEQAPIQQLSEKASKILNIGERVKGVVRPFVSLTTRLAEISPKIASLVQRSKQKAHLLISERTAQSEQFAKSTKTYLKTLTKDEQASAIADILNGNWESLIARGIEGTTELRQMFNDIAADIGVEATLENYFRRNVKDYDGLVKHLGQKPRGVFKRAIDDARAKKGEELTDDEKRQAVQGALRAGGGDGLKQKRTIETVTPEMAQFYEHPLDTLNNYIRQTSQVAARNEALGLTEAVTDEFGEAVDVSDDSIKGIIADLVGEDTLTKKQESELKSLLKTELGQKGAPPVVQAMQKMASLKYVTKLKTVVKQMGDVFVAIGENGIENVLGQDEANNWKDAFGNAVKLSLESIGVNTLDAELQSNKKRIIEDVVFKPLSLSDIAGKSILLKSTAQKWHTMSKSNPTKLKDTLMRRFNDEAFVDTIIADMSNDLMSGDVTFALYAQMAAFHPVSHSEHIKFYIDNPNMRMLFILKSFAFKRFDRLYRESLAPTVDGMAKHMAGYKDGNEALMKEGADDFAVGITGLSRFLIFSIAGEALIDKMYKEIMQSLGFAPEEPPEEESYVGEYLQELGRIAPFVDAYSLKRAIERGDPSVYWEDAYDVPTPIGLDTIKSIGKHMAGKDDKSWTKDVPWLGEFLSGKEKVRKAEEAGKKEKKPRGIAGRL